MSYSTPNRELLLGGRPIIFLPEAFPLLSTPPKPRLDAGFVGVRMTHRVRGTDVRVRAILRCGDTGYSVHPLVVIDESGKMKPLPETRGLIAARFDGFTYELASRRQRLTVKQAELDLVAWADLHIAGYA